MKLNMLDEGAPHRPAAQVIASAAWHSLFWLVTANAIGVLLAILLLVPSLNPLLGEWTYGRWIMVHMNLELYGWTSLPLVAFLFKIYGADRGPGEKWCRPVLWVWSTALGVGALSWLSGHSSGKLFLDWTGYSRVLFIAALFAVWTLLAFAFLRGLSRARNTAMVSLGTRLFCLLILFAVPMILHLASSPNSYPPVNPDTGAPRAQANWNHRWQSLPSFCCCRLGSQIAKPAAIGSSLLAGWC